ncbi:hypothetical protein WIW90_06075 [Sulfolobaceae archaeon RB850M]
MNPKLIKYYVAIIYAVSAVIGFVIAFTLLPAQTQLMTISSPPPPPPPPPAPLPQAEELQNLTSKYFGGNWTTINSVTGHYVSSDGGFTAYLTNSSTAQLSSNTVKDLTGLNYIQTMIQNISNELTSLAHNYFNFTQAFSPLESALNYLLPNSMNVIVESNGSAVFITLSLNWTENNSPIQPVYNSINSWYSTIETLALPIINGVLNTNISIISTTVNTTIVNNSTVNNITSTKTLTAYYLYIPINVASAQHNFVLNALSGAIFGIISLIINHFLDKSLQIFSVGILLGITPNSFSITLVINFTPAVQALINLVNSAIGLVDSIQS